jgi:hypothetical protein
VLEPYVSSEDIDKGTRWSTDISKELENSTYGILCVTAENIDAPWLNFEAGALSKSVDKSRVSPFLIGVKRAELHGPLLQFQSTVYDKDDVRKLLQSLNEACDPTCMDESRLNGIFDVWWPKLKEELDSLDKEAGKPSGGEEKVLAKSGRGLENRMLEEILELTRT